MQEQLKAVTVKVMGITGLFLLSITPFCSVFLSGAVVPFTTTLWLDRVLPLSMMNGLVQPALYIYLIKRLRKGLVRLVTCRGEEEVEGTSINTAGGGGTSSTFASPQISRKN